jgi:hypothetical protein
VSNETCNICIFILCLIPVSVRLLVSRNETKKMLASDSYRKQLESYSLQEEEYALFLERTKNSSDLDRAQLCKEQRAFFLKHGRTLPWFETVFKECETLSRPK